MISGEDDRLWCFCRQPHNNQMMICFDKCDDWFHGECVNVIEPMDENEEWVCPNCTNQNEQLALNPTTQAPNEIDSGDGDEDDQRI